MITIDYSRDSLITPMGLETLKDRYMVESEKSPQEAFARAAVAFASNKDHAQRIYDYASKQWFMFSTPILSNGGTKRGLPISCYLNYIGDSRKGLAEHYVENIWLSSTGGGIGGYSGALRSDGSSTSGGSRSTGIIPFLHVVDSQMMAFQQGTARRGAYASYQDISHPEIEEFINMRKPSGGDINRKNLNLHHGVNIPDSFMEKLTEKDDSWELIDPHSKKVTKVVSARELWQTIMDTRVATGEPYLHFIDASNRHLPKEMKDKGLKVNSSNLCCVSSDTKVLTKSGYVEIGANVGKWFHVWNGEEWSEVQFKLTQKEVPTLKVTFDNGQQLDCSYNHKFYIQDGYKKDLIRVVEASELVVGDRLEKFVFPIIDTVEEEMKYPYTHGVFCGDGNYKDKLPLVRLYGDKRKLAEHLDKRQSNVSHSTDEFDTWLLPKDLAPKFQVPLNFSINTKLKWLAGILDTDGCVSRNKDSDYLMLGSINKEFLIDIQLLLSTLGVSSSIKTQHNGEVHKIKGITVSSKPLYVLYISGTGLYNLTKLGLKTYRLTYRFGQPEMDTSRYVKVQSVEYSGIQDVFCFTEPLKNKGVFNGILTGQSEIILPTSEDRTALCCLSSVNLEKYDEWKDDIHFIRDLVEYLDNVLQYFIENAGEGLEKAVFSASQERSIGLGAMGFHSYLQSKNIPIESAMAIGINKKMFKHINQKAMEANYELGTERGEAPDTRGTGKRMAHLIAIAPNASSSVICGNTSPSIEPHRANIYTHKTLSGSFQIRNKWLEKLLDSKGKNIPEVWSSIVAHQGSVQQLKFLSDNEKDTFKTAIEIDQEWLVQLAADRQEYICQAQSLNLFFPPNVTAKELHSVHYNAWTKKLKTLYYLRSEAASRPENIESKIERRKLGEEEECISCQG